MYNNFFLNENWKLWWKLSKNKYSSFLKTYFCNLTILQIQICFPWKPCFKHWIGFCHWANNVCHGTLWKCWLMEESCSFSQLYYLYSVPTMCCSRIDRLCILCSLSTCIFITKTQVKSISMLRENLCSWIVRVVFFVKM